MLVLSRKEGERLVIDGNIVITVVCVAGGRVKLGIEAPAEVSIRREELVPLPAKRELCCSISAYSSISATAAR